MNNKEIQVDLGEIISFSTIDWHGKSSCVIFFNKCNFRCPWCQNYKLLEKTNLVDINNIKKEIYYAKDFVTTVVFSGGEPTNQPICLEELAKFSKRHNLLVGIETNGYFPNVLKNLVEKGLIDKIFLDIKTDPLNQEKYSKITGVNDSNKKIIKSLHIGNRDIIEVRTTVFRSTIEDILDIAKFLEEEDYSGIYIVQQGIPMLSNDKEIRKEKILTKEEIGNKIKKISYITGIKIKMNN